MDFLQVLGTMPSYFNYFFHVVDEHSLQSPFVFELYNSIVKATTNQRGHQEIEAIRKNFLGDHQFIEGNDFGAGSRSGKNRTIASIAKNGISSLKTSLFLLELARYFNAKTIVELGTSLGINTMYLSKTGPDAMIYSLEGNEKLADIASDSFKNAGMENISLVRGNIDHELPVLIQERSSVDFVFIDANHKKEAVMRYMEMVKGRLSEIAVVVLDDIRWSADMYKAWELLYKDNTFNLTIDMLNLGVLIKHTDLKKQHYYL